MPVPRPEPTWSVVVTLTGPVEMAAPFVAHHLGTGAQRIHVYLDRPDPELAAALAALPRCVAVTCDDAYWRARRGRQGRPEGLVSRQLINAEHARSVAGTDWLVHLDSDEFLHEDRPFAAVLAQVPADTHWVHLPNVERVLPAGRPQQTIFDGLFRSQILQPRRVAAIWGDDARFLRNGFSAYVAGKIAIRCASPLQMRLHFAVDASGDPDRLPPVHPAQDVFVRHLDGWTPLHWTVKIDSLAARIAQANRKGGHRGRQAQLDYFAAVPDQAQRMALYRRLHVLDDARMAALRAAGALHDMPLDPRPAIARYFPQVSFSYDPAAFDARLGTGP